MVGELATPRIPRAFVEVIPVQVNFAYPPRMALACGSVAVAWRIPAFSEGNVSAVVTPFLPIRRPTTANHPGVAWFDDFLLDYEPGQVALDGRRLPERHQIRHHQHGR